MKNEKKKKKKKEKKKKKKKGKSFRSPRISAYRITKCCVLALGMLLNKDKTNTKSQENNNNKKHPPPRPTPQTISPKSVF